MNLSYSTDIVIFGGGIAGLWLLKRLRLEGYQAILLESNQLGSGQTLASQGIIHGGLKYALSGSLTEAANAIAEMPARWRQCLVGEDPIDLRKVTVLSDQYYMWSATSFRSKLKTFLGSKSLRGRVEAVSKDQLPGFFANDAANGSLYRLPDFVIDSGSLIKELCKGQEDYLFHIDPQRIDFVRGDDDQITAVRIGTSEGSVQINCRKCVLSAGEGNETLLSQCGMSNISMQRRPLHMVYVKHKDLPAIYTHCIGDDFSLTPMLTVTSHRDENDATVWYLGGELAESGVEKSADEQIKAAQAQLQIYFPWVDLSAAEWDSFIINRAEAQMADKQRPDDSVFSEENHAIAVFPTKFTLTPSLADKLVSHLEATAVGKSDQSTAGALRELLPPPPLGSAHWENNLTD